MGGRPAIAGCLRAPVHATSFAGPEVAAVWQRALAGEGGISGRRPRPGGRFGGSSRTPPGVAARAARPQTPEPPPIFYSVDRRRLDLRELTALLRGGVEGMTQLAERRGGRPKGQELTEEEVARMLEAATVAVGAYARENSPEGSPLLGGLGSLLGVNLGSSARLVGFAAAASDKALVGTVHSVVVAEDVRGRGVGRRLVAQATVELAREGISDVGLMAVPGSTGFFEACDFGPDETGAVLMAFDPFSPALPQASGSGGQAAGEHLDPMRHLRVEVLERLLREHALRG